jgi:hypothetical protein
MKNQSKKAEKLTPQDSERKEIHHPENDNEAVINPEDLQYRKEEPDFKDIAVRKEQQEQPVQPIKDPPKED